MNARKSAYLFLLFCGLMLVGGCESTQDTQGDGAAASKEERQGGNVRRTTFHPKMPSEINEADFRYW